MFQAFTRGNVSPAGKQKVYMTGLAKDMNSYAAEAAGLILKEYDCAVWYDDGKPVLDEEETGDRAFPDGTMLVVVLITRDYLNEDEESRTRRIPEKAAEENVPILPYVLEEHCDIAMFEARFGKIQFLYRNEEDRTGIPFEKKLQDYLSRILVKDAEREEIEAAFDSRIFLSYRKKDRAAADRLIREIHRDPACRDTAIWYDEFLTYGERYDDEIEQELLASPIFMLAVTPNLFCEKNYVIETELPLAVRCQKRIIPVELIPVEPESRRLIQGIWEDRELPGPEEAAGEVRKCIGSARFQKRDARHEYLIGLAYLNGIGVENDAERGIKLLTSAAERGYGKAMEKLVCIYAEGIHVRTGAAEKLRWQRRLVDLYWDVFQQDRTVESCESLLRQMNILLDFCLDDEPDNIGEIKRVTDDMIALCKALPPDQDTTVARYMVHVCSILGRIFYSGGLMQEALNRYQLQLEYAGILLDAGDNSFETWQARFCGFVDAGNVAFALRELGEEGLRYAYKMYTLAQDQLAYMESLYPGNEYRRDRAGLCERFGYFYLNLEDYDEALRYFTEAVSLGLAVYQEFPTVQNCRTLALRYDALGDCWEEMDEFEEAVKCFRKAIHARKEIFESCLPGGRKYAFSQSVGIPQNYYRIAELDYTLGNMDEAEMALGYAVDLLKEMVSDGIAGEEEKLLLHKSLVLLGMVRG